MLEIRGATSSPNPGDTVGVRTPDPGVDMVAGWSGSSVTLLSLGSITLPDGTGLEDAGYTATFDSGNRRPAPTVPEPTTWLGWGLLSAASARGFRRRRRG